MSIQRLSNSGQSGFRYKSLIAGITPVASVPTIGTATALTFSTASVTFTAPGAYAGATYTATSSPGGLTGTSATSPITVSGLSEQTAYTFTVTATNATGTSGPSAATSSITTPAAFTPDSGYDSLATVTLSATAATVVFSGIPSGYKHLQVRSTSFAGNGSYLRTRFNGDTAGNYSWHMVSGQGSSAFTDSGTSDTSMAGPSQATSANTFSASIMDVLDYADTNKYKTVRYFGGKDQNGSGNIALHSGSWRNTAAVTSITFFGSGVDFPQYTHFALYGVK